MKALTLTQPWATLVAIGAKEIETRSWQTHYRGPLAIHAAVGLGPVGGIDGLRSLCCTEPFISALRGGGIDMDQVDVDALPRGAIIATARIADVRCIVHHWMEPVDPAVIGDRLPLPNDPELTFGDYTPGRFAWLLADMRPLATPIPCRGALGLWTVPDDVAAIVERDALERATR